MQKSTLSAVHIGERVFDATFHPLLCLPLCLDDPLQTRDGGKTKAVCGQSRVSTKASTHLGVELADAGM